MVNLMVSAVNAYLLKLLGSRSMRQEEVLEYLEGHKIDYDLIEHQAIFTITELNALVDYPDKDKVAKNLFLRNDSGSQHYLVLVRSDKKVNLKALRQQIGSSRLGFASEERLKKHLNLTKGSVSPLGIINDQSKSIPVLIDEDLRDARIIGVHPNINTATLWMSHKAIVSAITAHGNEVIHVSIPSE